MKVSQSGKQSGGGMVDRMRSLKRQTKQRVLTNLGKAEMTKDPVYDELAGKLSAMEKALGKLYKDTRRYIEAMRSYVQSSCVLSESICETYEATAKLRSAALEGAAIAGDVDSKFRPDLEKDLERKLLEPIQQFLVLFPAIKKRMEQRERLLLDYDSYRRKVSKLRNDPKADPREVEDKENKLRMATESYTTYNERLVYELAALEEHRADIVDGPFIALAGGQIRFFGDTLRALSQLQRYIDENNNRPMFTMESWQAAVDNLQREAHKDEESNGGTDSFMSSSTSPPSTSVPHSSGEVVVALYAFKGEAGELSFNAGDMIKILGKDNESGWWQGELNGVMGQFPANYVQTQATASAHPSAAMSSSSLRSTTPSPTHSQPQTAPTSPQQHKSAPTSQYGQPPPSSDLGGPASAPLTSAAAPTPTSSLLPAVANHPSTSRSSSPVPNAAVTEHKDEDDLSEFSRPPTAEVSPMENISHPVPQPMEKAVPPPADKPAPPQAATRRAKALYEYAAIEDVELSFKAGDVITVISEDSSGWWEGSLNGKVGLFPANYAEEIK